MTEIRMGGFFMGKDLLQTILSMAQWPSFTVSESRSPASTSPARDDAAVAADRVE
jgi:hypothetical protein